MFYDFEVALTKVKSKKTKKYLQEVLSTYHNQEYRACIITLYVITFADALEKIKILAEVYQDEKAAKFLEEYEKDRKDKTKYSQLEKKVIDFIVKSGLMNDVEEKQWEHLKDYRDFCAHPVVGNDYELISPNASQVKAHIRNMFDALFLKDAILLDNHLFNEFVRRVEEFYDRNGFDGIKKYTYARYIENLDLNTKYKFVKNLWIFAFSGDDSECQKYRAVAYWELVWIIESDKPNLLKLIEKNIDYFSGKIKYDEVVLKRDESNFDIFDNRTITLIYFLHRLPEIYKLLSQDNQIYIYTTIKKNVNLMLLSSFAYENKKKHIEEVQESIKILNFCFDPTIVRIVCRGEYDEYDACYNEVLIYYFCNCQDSPRWKPDYDYINRTYRDILEGAIPYFTEKQIEKLLKALPTGYKEATCLPLLAKQIVEIVNTNHYEVDFTKYDVNIMDYLENSESP